MKFFFRITLKDSTVDRLRELITQCGHEECDSLPDADYIVQYHEWSEKLPDKGVLVLIGSFYTKRWVQPNAICIDGTMLTAQISPDAPGMDEFVMTKPIPLHQFIHEFLPLTTA